MNQKLLILFFGTIITIFTLTGCQEDTFGDYPAKYHYAGVEKVDSKLYVSKGFNEFLTPLEIEGSASEYFTNFSPSRQGTFYFDEITFQSSDSVYLLSTQGVERTRHYTYDGIEKVILPDALDFYKSFYFDETSKEVRHPLALIYKIRHSSNSSSPEIKTLVLNRGFDTIEEVAQFGAFGDLFYMENDSMGVLLYDLVFRM